MTEQDCIDFYLKHHVSQLEYMIPWEVATFYKGRDLYFGKQKEILDFVKKVDDAYIQAAKSKRVF